MLARILLGIALLGALAVAGWHWRQEKKLPLLQPAPAEARG
ncbi:hypothetical protein [Sandaracinobacter neustonicus]|nr:hypothetical protein [Sandaracinobacter neustonicus]